MPLKTPSVVNVFTLRYKRSRLHAALNCSEVCLGLGMLPGAFERTAGGMNALKLDPVNMAADKSRDS